jgi:hypothetical protein
MGGNGEGKKWIIIIWIWVSTRVDLSIPSPVAGLAVGDGGRNLPTCPTAAQTRAVL